MWCWQSIMQASCSQKPENSSTTKQHRAAEKGSNEWVIAGHKGRKVGNNVVHKTIRDRTAAVPISW